MYIRTYRTIRVALGDLWITKPLTLQTNTIARRLNYEKRLRFAEFWLPISALYICTSMTTIIKYVIVYVYRI